MAIRGRYLGHSRLFDLAALTPLECELRYALPSDPEALLPSDADSPDPYIPGTLTLDFEGEGLDMLVLRHPGLKGGELRVPFGDRENPLTHYGVQVFALIEGTFRSTCPMCHAPSVVPEQRFCEACGASLVVSFGRRRQTAVSSIMPWGTSDIDYEVGAGRVLGPNITVAAVPLKVKASHGDALPPELIKFEAHLVYRALKKRVGHHLAMGVVWRTENGSDDEELCFRPLLFAMDVGLAADLVSQGSHVVRRYRVLPYSDINEALVALLVDDSRQQHQLASVDGRPAVLEVFESVISLNSQLEYPVVSLIISANAHPDELARLGLLFAD